MIGYSIAVSAIAIMIGIGGIVFGLGYAMDNQKLRNFGRDELIQSFINGAIVGSLFLFLSPSGLGTGIINGLVSSGNVTVSCGGPLGSNYAICFAHNYLVGLAPVTINKASYPSLLDSSLELLIPVSGLYFTLGLISSSQLNLGIASISFSTILAPVLSQQEFIIKTLTFAIIGIYTQAALLSVISIVAVPLVLPVGMVLRTFYPTRRLGGTMIAIAIGLFAVFPLTYVLDAQITASYSASVAQTAISQFTNQSQAIQAGIFGVGSSSISANSISAVAKGLVTGVAALAGSLVTLVQELISYIALMIVQVFFFPLFSIVLTITSIRELSRLLGSEVSFGKFDVF